MFNMIRVTIVLLALSKTGIAHGAGLRGDGNELLKRCQTSTQSLSYENLLDFYWCLGFLEGVNGMLPSTTPPLYCLPEAGSYTQVMQVLVKYLQDHPERLNESQTVLTVDALGAAFPCEP